MDEIRAAGAVISDDAGRVLLVQRAHDPQKGCWSVPGGRCEPGETLEQAAAREACEETGLNVRIGRELWTLRVPAGADRIYEVHDFAATVVDGTLLAGDDADDVRWVDPAELDRMPLTTNLRPYLRRAGI